MKITVKTLQQKVFTIDAEGTDTVGDLKAKISASQGHEVANQKLIYSGKVLSDDKSVESCAIKEKDFLVLMVSKTKQPTTSAAAASSSAAPAASETPVAPQAPAAPVEPAPVPAQPGTGTESSGTMAGLAGDASFLTGTALQTTINNMVEMGFERDLVMRALRASFNNPDRAVEYLMNGIPAHLEAAAAGGSAATQSPASAPASQSGTGVTPSTTPAAPANAPAADVPQNLFQLAQQQQQGGAGRGAAGAGAGLPLGPGGIDPDALRNIPQFQQLRELMQQNPALIQPLLQQLAAANPGLAQTMANNPGFLQDVLGLENDGGEGGNPPPGSQVIEVTVEERAAIERLEALGFPRHVVLEAYLACDRNEELAANYLFENGFEDD